MKKIYVVLGLVLIILVISLFSLIFSENNKKLTNDNTSRQIEEILDKNSNPKTDGNCMKVDITDEKPIQVFKAGTPEAINLVKQINESNTVWYKNIYFYIFLGTILLIVLIILYKKHLLLKSKNLSSQKFLTFLILFSMLFGIFYPSDLYAATIGVKAYGELGLDEGSRTHHATGTFQTKDYADILTDSNGKPGVKVGGSYSQPLIVQDDTDKDSYTVYQIGNAYLHKIVVKNNEIVEHITSDPLATVLTITGSHPTYYNGNIYLGHDGIFYVINADTLKVINKYNVGDYYPSGTYSDIVAAPTVWGNLVIAGYFINKDDGNRYTDSKNVFNDRFVDGGLVIFDIANKKFYYVPNLPGTITGSGVVYNSSYYFPIDEGNVGWIRNLEISNGKLVIGGKKLQMNSGGPVSLSIYKNSIVFSDKMSNVYIYSPEKSKAAKITSISGQQTWNPVGLPLVGGKQLISVPVSSTGKVYLFKIDGSNSPVASYDFGNGGQTWCAPITFQDKNGTTYMVQGNFAGKLTAVKIGNDFTMTNVSSTFFKDGKNDFGAAITSEITAYDNKIIFTTFNDGRLHVLGSSEGDLSLSDLKINASSGPLDLKDSNLSLSYGSTYTPEFNIKSTFKINKDRKLWYAVWACDSDGNPLTLKDSSGKNLKDANGKDIPYELGRVTIDKATLPASSTASVTKYLKPTDKLTFTVPNASTKDGSNVNYNDIKSIKIKASLESGTDESDFTNGVDLNNTIAGAIPESPIKKGADGSIIIPITGQQIPDDLSLSGLVVKPDTRSQDPSSLFRGEWVTYKFVANNTFSTDKTDTIEYTLSALDVNQNPIASIKLPTLSPTNISLKKNSSHIYPTEFSHTPIYFQVPADSNVKYIKFNAKLGILPEETDKTNNELKTGKDTLLPVEDTVNLKANKYVGETNIPKSQSNINVGVNASNLSQSDLPVVQFKAELYKGSTLINSSTKTFTSNMPRNSIKDYTTSIPSPQTLGFYKVVMTVNSDKTIPESNYNDNKVEQMILISNSGGGGDDNGPGGNTGDELDLIAVSYIGKPTVRVNEGVYEAGLKVSNNAGRDLPNVLFKIDFDGSISYNTETLLNGTHDYKFTLPCNKPIGNGYPISITVNPEGTNMTVAEANYNNNTKTGSVNVVASMPPPPDNSTELFDFIVSLEELSNPYSGGPIANPVTTLNTKSGYGIPIVAEVQSFNYFPSNIAGERSYYYSDLSFSPTVTYTSTLQLPSNMNDSVMFENTLSSGDSFRRFCLTQNTWSKLLKRKIYTNPGLVDGSYNITATAKASGRYTENYQTNDIVGYTPTYSITDEDGNVIGTGGGYPIYDWVWHSRTRGYDYTESNTVTVNIDGSMYDDDNVIITQ